MSVEVKHNIKQMSPRRSGFMVGADLGISRILESGYRQLQRSVRPSSIRHIEPVRDGKELPNDKCTHNWIARPEDPEPNNLNVPPLDDNELVDIADQPSQSGGTLYELPPAVEESEARKAG